MQVTTLADLTTSHLKLTQANYFKDILNYARQWVEDRPDSPGLSFVITGPVGTGKTTIARNLMRSADEIYEVLNAAGQPVEEVSMGRGRFIPAAEIISILDLGRAHWGLAFRDVHVIVIDDVGTEDFRFVGASEKKLVRQNRYGEFVDWCWQNGVSLVITSMVPLSLDNKPNEEFMSILGRKAFDRLWQMAAGHMFTFGDFPSYRREK